MSDYFERISNHAPRLKPFGGNPGTRPKLLPLDTPQFLSPERRVDARRDQLSRREMARPRPGNRDVRVGPE